MTIPVVHSFENLYLLHLLLQLSNTIKSSKLPTGIKEIVIKTSDNIKLNCLYLSTINSNNKLLIYFHGNAGNIYHRISDLIQLTRSGVNVLGVSYRGYGKSEGDPSEYGVYEDGRSVLKFAKERLNYLPKNIFILGRSIGASVAINTSLNSELAGIILVTPLSTGKQQASAFGLGMFASIAGDSFNNLEKITQIKSPLLVIHGTNDEIVPYSMGKAVFDHAVVPKQFITIKGGKHNDLQNYGSLYWNPIFNFIREQY